MQERPRKHAIIIGGSIAGMLTARVLADYYERVTVLDRDTFPEQPDHRKSVPQSQHAHGFLARGQMIIHKLFPGIIQEIREDGATADGPLVVVTPAGRLPTLTFDDAPPEEQGKENLAGAYVSRVLLEWHIRRRLRILDNIDIQSGIEVVDLLTSADQQTVLGVQLRQRHAEQDNSTTEDHHADLVVDASGRNSKVLSWLEEMGYEQPPEETVNSGMGYISRFYRKPENFPDEWAGIIINGRAPDNPRAGLILPIEDDKWHVTVGGIGGHHPTNSEEGFMQWARELPDPSLYEAIRVAEPITPIRGHRSDMHRLRHFEKLTRWPQNFIVTGDAVCAFNPIYGQGMTTSALDAMAIRKVLKEREENPKLNFERRVRDEIAKTVADPWLVATGEDLRWEGVKLEGASSLTTPILHRYMNVYLKQALEDKQLAGLYFAVLNMLAPPKMLAHPVIALRVLGKAMLGLFKKREPENRYALTSQALDQLRSHPAFGEI